MQNKDYLTITRFHRVRKSGSLPDKVSGAFKTYQDEIPPRLVIPRKRAKAIKARIAARITLPWQITLHLQVKANRQIVSQVTKNWKPIFQMDRWSVGRTMLLGDAAYCASPASGQGTSLALVGAYVLAGELAGALGDYSTAFARYEHAMRGYVVANQKLAGSVKDFMPQTGTQIWLRAQTLRVLPYLPWKGLLAGQMMRDVQQAAHAITLKDYESVNG